MLFLRLCASCWKLATYQYQRWDNFCFQNLRTQNLLFLHVNSSEWRHLLDSKKKRCMVLAYVDKLAKDNNGAKYLLVRQGLFDRTLDAKRVKTKKIPRKWCVRFWLWLRKRIFPKKFGLTREQNLMESLKNYAKLKEYKFTLQWVRPTLILLNVQYDPWKINSTVTWKTSAFTIYSIRYNTKF